MIKGDYIRARSHGMVWTGRIISVFNGTPYDDEGLASLTFWGPQPMRFVNSQWCTALVHDDSQRTSLYVPEELVEQIEPFVLINSRANRYFIEHSAPTYYPTWASATIAADRATANTWGRFFD